MAPYQTEPAFGISFAGTRGAGRRLPGLCETTALTQEGLYLLNLTVTGRIEEELPPGNGEEVAPLRSLPHLLISAGDRDCCSSKTVERAPEHTPRLLSLRLVRVGCGLPVLSGCFILVN